VGEDGVKRMDVLIVDDNVDLAENLAEILSDEGFACRVADSGEAALACLSEQTFDLVVTDMKMQHMDGLALLREINQRWPQTPVVIMTAYARDRQVDDARREGAIEILAKPLDAAVLLSIVERFTDEESRRVLIVEDDDDLRDNLQEIMSSVPGVEVTVAPSIERAREELARGVFDVAIVDVRLPDGDGVAFGQELMAQQGRCARLVLMTAFASEIAGALRSVGLDPEPKLLRKPFPPAVLIAVVREAV
jgi:two-component system, response regulator PdtaR